MVARDRFHTSIWIHKVGAAISYMSNSDLLTNHQCGSKRCSAARCLFLDGTLGLANSRLHNLLKGFLHGIWFNVEEVRMKLTYDISCNATNGSIACYFTELVTPHPIRNNIETEGKIARI